MDLGTFQFDASNRMVGHTRQTHQPGTEIKLPGDEARASLRRDIGEWFIGHEQTFGSVYNLTTKTYRSYFDEALRANWQDALALHRDPMVAGYLQNRYLPVMALNYRIEPDNPDDPDQSAVAKRAEKIYGAIPRMLDFRGSLLEAIFFGRAGVQMIYGWKRVDGERVRTVVDHEPLNGDKIVWRWGGRAPGVMVNAGYVSPMGVTPEYHDRGAFLPLDHPMDRARFAIHRFRPTDADYLFEADQAGQIGGLGLRGRLYHAWWLRTEVWGWFMDGLQRIGSNGQRYAFYEEGNLAHRDSVLLALAELNRDNYAAFPRRPNMPESTITSIPPTDVAFNVMLDCIKYFDEIIRRLVLGQDLSSTTAPTGLGSGVADLHKDVLKTIIKTDAVSLAETETEEVLSKIVAGNKWIYRGKVVRELPFGLKVKAVVGGDAAMERLNAAQILIGMNVPIDLESVRDEAGFKPPKDAEDSHVDDPTQQPPPGEDPNAMGAPPADPNAAPPVDPNAPPPAAPGAPPAAPGAPLAAPPPPGVAMPPAAPPVQYRSGRDVVRYADVPGNPKPVNPYATLSKPRQAPPVVQPSATPSTPRQATPATPRTPTPRTPATTGSAPHPEDSAFPNGSPEFKPDNPNMRKPKSGVQSWSAYKPVGHPMEEHANNYKGPDYTHYSGSPHHEMMRRASVVLGQKVNQDSVGGIHESLIDGHSPAEALKKHGGSMGNADDRTKLQFIESYRQANKIPHAQSPNLPKFREAVRSNYEESSRDRIRYGGEGSGDHRVMVCLKIPSSIASTIAVPGGESADDMHVTIAYFGRRSTLGREGMRAIKMAVGALAKQYEGLDGVVGGRVVFPASPSSDGKTVNAASVDVPGLAEYRQRLLDSLALLGIEAKADHGYTPHVTIEYADHGTPLHAPTDSHPVRFGEVCIVTGSTWARVPFAGHRKLRYAGQFQEGQHPRGQPENKGEFAPKPGGGSPGAPGASQGSPQAPAAQPATQAPAAAPAGSQGPPTMVGGRWVGHRAGWKPGPGWSADHEAILRAAERGLANDQFVKDADKIPGLAEAVESRRVHYAKAMREVLGRMPAGMAEVVGNNLGSMTFVPALNHVVESLQKKGVDIEAGTPIAGYVEHSPSGTTDLLLDGGLDEMNDGRAYANQLTQDIYAHELSHVIDHGDEQSSNKAWGDVWQQEIAGGSLSAYATHDQTEAFAEFGRLLCSEMPKSEIKAQFPAAYDHWFSRGWI